MDPGISWPHPNPLVKLKNKNKNSISANESQFPFCIIFIFSLSLEQFPQSGVNVDLPVELLLCLSSPSRTLKPLLTTSTHSRLVSDRSLFTSPEHSPSMSTEALLGTTLYRYLSLSLSLLIKLLLIMLSGTFPFSFHGIFWNTGVFGVYC